MEWKIILNQSFIKNQNAAIILQEKMIKLSFFYSFAGLPIVARIPPST